MTHFYLARVPSVQGVTASFSGDVGSVGASNGAETIAVASPQDATQINHGLSWARGYGWPHLTVNQEF